MTHSAQDFNQNPSLIFIHVPKTAGTTLVEIMARQYGEDAVFWTTNEVITAIAKSKIIPKSGNSRFKLIHGHLSFGVDELLPYPSQYFTVMRDPIDRMISEYYYIQQATNHPKHIIAKSARDIKEYVRSGLNREADNGQTRRISGVGNKIPFGQCSDEVLELAKRNLKERFLMVGIAERFDHTIVLLSKLLGWSPPFYAKLNVTKKRPRKDSLSDGELKLIEKYNQLDIALYQYAQTLLDDVIGQYGDAFYKEVEEFQKLNAETGEFVLSRTPQTINIQAQPQLSPEDINELQTQLTKTKLQLAQTQQKVKLLRHRLKKNRRKLKQARAIAHSIESSKLWWLQQQWIKVKGKIFRTQKKK
jgi:uncharacterized coiled-coil protein SlyX